MKLWLRVAGALRLVIAGLALCAATAYAQDYTISYQGKLTDGGNPANGSFDMLFDLYDTPTIGTGTHWSGQIAQPGVVVTGGIFTVKLDFGNPYMSAGQLFLQIAVRPAGVGGYTQLSPRQQLTASAYAVQTINAHMLGNVPATRYVAGDANGNIALGTLPDTQMKLKVQAGPSQLPLRVISSGSSGFSAGWDFYHGANGRGYVGVPDSGAPGVGAEMILFSAPGVPASLWSGGQRAMTLSSSTQNVGVGMSPDPNVRLSATSGGNPYAMYGVSVNGTGIWGASTSGTGVYGSSSAQNSLTHAGVWGVGNGSGSIGVHGQANVANAVGVFGESASSSGFGVYARNTNGGRALLVDGPASQSLAYGGLVKALIHVDSNGAVIRCFNGLTGSTVAPCGFSVSHPIVGNYTVNFGFQVDDRFTLHQARINTFPNQYPCHTYTANSTTNTITLGSICYASIVDGPLIPTDIGFFIVVL